MKNITLHMINDPGHAWLSVPNALVREVDRINGVAERISAYSFITDDRAYFEEDRDAGLFVKAALDAGLEVKIGAPRFASRSAQCRQFPAFTADRLRLDIRPGARYFSDNIRGGAFVHLVDLPGESRRGGSYVVALEGNGSRYAVKPHDFHGVLKSEAYGEAVLARRKMEPFLVQKLPPQAPTDYGRGVIMKLFSAFDRAGGPMASISNLCGEWPASFVRACRSHDADHQAPPFLKAESEEWLMSNLAVNALQYAAWLRSPLASRSLVPLVQVKDEILGPGRDDAAAGRFLNLLSQRVAVPPSNTLDLNGPFVADDSGGVLFLTFAEGLDGLIHFEVRRMSGSPYSEGAISSLVAETQSRDDAVDALYRRVARDVLEDPAILAHMDLSEADRRGIQTQARLLSAEGDDAALLIGDTSSPVSNDDDAADLVMI